ncbi:ABC transporter permease [Halioxenophilus aromaticivorans]|uniref:ABC transporter permease n=1 Tax=Halioxenophilus aromaticivorans TaxID=1306992 RepID=A0AAV3TXI1_9ALTE
MIAAHKSAWLALKLLWRHWRSGELRILSTAVILAVTVVTAIAVFADRMDRSISRQSNGYLAADRQVVSRFAIPEQWREQAQQFDVQQSGIIEFASMAFAEDEMTLASVKAVEAGYPLRGDLEISEQAFPPASEVAITLEQPAAGTVWVDSTLLPMLGIELGGQVAIGNGEFTVSKVVVHEPDGSQGFSMTGPRILMNAADVAATEVIQPGSRITYKWLIAGEEGPLEAFESWIKPQLGDHYEWVTLQESQRNVSQALVRGKSFLMLAGMVGVLLAGVAVAIAAQQFARVQQDSVALLKSLGCSARLVRTLYFGQIVVLGLLATAVGLVLGDLLHRIIAASVAGLFNVEFVSSGVQPYIIGVATGILTLVCFALPPLWPLPALSPVRIFRSSVEMAHIGLLSQASFGLAAIIVIIGLYSGDVKLTLTVVVGIIVIALLAMLAGLVLLRGTQRIGARAGSIFRLAVANLMRNGKHSITQLVVFSTAFMLLLVMFLVRTSLIDEWRMQLPEDAPNHFLVNIAQSEAGPVRELFAASDYRLSPLYPIILARLVARNDYMYQEQDRPKSNTLRRELNLSWAEELPADNKILDGQWWDHWQGEGYGVSVEEDTAKELELSVGDRLRYSIGGLELTATVASIRSVDWNALTPNFYFLFSPGALTDYSPSYLASAYVDKRDSEFIPNLIRTYPTISVIEVDRIIDRIKTIIDQVGQGIELVLWVVILGGVLVLVATVNASMTNRLHETSLIRALGSSKRVIVGSLWLEFSLLGLCAGIMAVISCEVLMVALRVLVFEQQVVLHPWVWLVGPLLASASVGALGALACRKVVTVPPGLVLREIHS